MQIIHDAPWEWLFWCKQRTFESNKNVRNIVDSKQEIPVFDIISQAAEQRC